MRSLIVDISNNGAVALILDAEKEPILRIVANDEFKILDVFTLDEILTTSQNTFTLNAVNEVSKKTLFEEIFSSILFENDDNFFEVDRIIISYPNDLLDSNFTLLNEAAVKFSENIILIPRIITLANAQDKKNNYDLFILQIAQSLVKSFFVKKESDEWVVVDEYTNAFTTESEFNSIIRKVVDEEQIGDSNKFLILDVNQKSLNALDQINQQKLNDFEISQIIPELVELDSNEKIFNWNQEMQKEFFEYFFTKNLLNIDQEDSSFNLETQANSILEEKTNSSFAKVAVDFHEKTENYEFSENVSNASNKNQKKDTLSTINSANFIKSEDSESKKLEQPVLENNNISQNIDKKTDVIFEENALRLDEKEVEELPPRKINKSKYNTQKNNINANLNSANVSKPFGQMNQFAEQQTKIKLDDKKRFRLLIRTVLSLIIILLIIFSLYEYKSYKKNNNQANQLVTFTLKGFESRIPQIWQEVEKETNVRNEVISKTFINRNKNDYEIKIFIDSIQPNLDIDMVYSSIYAEIIRNNNKSITNLTLGTKIGDKTVIIYNSKNNNAKNEVINSIWYYYLIGSNRVGMQCSAIETNKKNDDLQKICNQIVYLAQLKL